jgi:hypothetical protein
MITHTKRTLTIQNLLNIILNFQKFFTTCKLIPCISFFKLNYFFKHNFILTIWMWMILSTFHL